MMENPNGGGGGTLTQVKWLVHTLRQMLSSTELLEKNFCTRETETGGWEKLKRFKKKTTTS